MVSASAITLFDTHLYIMTMAYDTTHIVGIVVAGYILATGEVASLRAGEVGNQYSALSCMAASHASRTL